MFKRITTFQKQKTYQSIGDNKKLVQLLDDEVARWSGDKFLVFLPETTLEQGILAAEKRDRLLKNS